jgi:hypothetical protein
MARFPGAIWKPITADKDRQRLTVYNRMNLHVAVSEAASLHGYFNQRGIPDSHFYVRRDGTVEQYVDTSMRAYADLEGNDATISVETQGMGPGGWDAAQRESLARLYAWAVKTHGVARKVATSSKTDATSRGLSWHRLGCDGNFPSLPSLLAGRAQRGGGMHYSKSLGKVCPGDDRIKQIPSIFARAEDILDGTPTKQEDDVTLTQTERTQLAAIHSAIESKVGDIGTENGLTWRTAFERMLLIDRRTEARIVALTAAVQSLATSAGGDAKAITAAVTKSVDTALADLEITLKTGA